MSDESDGQEGSRLLGGALLMKTWSDGEGAIVRQLLESHGIPCQVVSDVPHSVLPITVDGLGEIRIVVPESRLVDARTIIAEHRRQGMEMILGGKSDEDPPETPEAPPAALGGDDS